MFSNIKVSVFIITSNSFIIIFFILFHIENINFLILFYVLSWYICLSNCRTCVIFNFPSSTLNKNIFTEFLSMKISRIRENKKIIKTLKSNGFRTPYQIIVDGSFINTIKKVENGISVLQKTLNDFPKFFITNCEYQKYKPNAKDKDLSGKCEIIKCKHENYDEKCVQKMFNGQNKHHYILASSNPKLICIRNEIKNIPLIKIKNSVFHIDIGDMKEKTTIFKGNKATKQELKRLDKLFAPVDKNQNIN